MRTPLRRALLWAATLGLAPAACDPTPGDLREWTAADHDQPSPGQAAQVSGDGPDPNLIDLAWQRQCSTCHGPRGRGDGPQGAMVRAPDLTDPAWQDRVTDAQIAEVIRKGRNKMPAFELPDQVVEGLVKRVRAARATLGGSTGTSPAAPPNPHTPPPNPHTP
jgi:cytochrome c oxidase cbb3-type subunit 3